MAADVPRRFVRKPTAAERSELIQLRDKGPAGGRSRALAGTLEVAHDHRVEPPIVSLDAADVEVSQLARRHPASTECVEQFGRACERINGSHGL